MAKIWGAAASASSAFGEGQGASRACFSSSCLVNCDAGNLVQFQ